MNNHTKTIIEQIAKFTTKIPDRKKDELFEILNNPDNALSGEFFELYNNKVASELVENEDEISNYEKKLQDFFSRVTKYDTDHLQEMASGDYRCVFANSADIIEWLEDNCEDWPYGVDYQLPLSLKSDENITPYLFDARNECVETLIHDWITYKALKHFFIEFSPTLTKGAFDSSSLIALIKHDILDKKIHETYKNLVNYVEYKQRTPKEQHTYINAHNDDVAKEIVDKDIDAIQDILEYGQYNIFDTKVSEIDSAIGGLLSNTNPKYISLLKKMIGLHNQAEENDMYLQNLFPLSKKKVKGSRIMQILLRYYKNNYSEQGQNITNVLLDIQQQEILLWARLKGHVPL